MRRERAGEMEGRICLNSNWREERADAEGREREKTRLNITLLHVPFLAMAHSQSLFVLDADFQLNGSVHLFERE